MNVEELGVDALLRLQFIVSAGLNNAALVEDEELMGVSQGRKPVRDGEGRATFDEPGDGFLDLLLGLEVYAGGGLIEDEDGGVVEDSAGDADALLLAA